MAREDFRDAQQDFSRGDFFGGMQELSEANEHMADGYSHLSGREYILTVEAPVPRRGDPDL